MKRMKFLLVAAAMMCMPAMAQNDVKNEADTIQLPAEGSEAPQFEALKKGVWNVIDFWATWCPDCRREIPTVKAMNQKYGTRAHFVGVSMDTDKQKLDSFCQQNGIGWQQYSEYKKWKDTQISKDYNITWLPTMFLVNPDGKIAYRTVLAEEMQKKLEEIFGAE